MITIYLKEIILGLRKEYLENERQLSDLKKSCQINTKKAIDFSFRVFQNQRKNPDLLCDYVKKCNIVQKLIEEKINPVYGRETAKLYHDNNGKYIFSGHPNDPIDIKEGHNKAFSELVTIILNSEFNCNIQSEYIEINQSQGYCALTLNSQRITLNCWNNDINNMDSMLIYWADNDAIQVFSCNKRDIADSRKLLNVKVPKKQLNPYHIRVIDESGIIEKNIILEQFEPCRDITFSIDENENRVVLEKCMKKL